ncbi:MAG: response regulator [Bacteroidetes bacterium]|nr:response regulator [Bacteroidota bacterium]
MNKKSFKILLIKDDSVDFELIMGFIKSSELNLDVQLCKDGPDALEFLFSKEVYQTINMPDLIILDLNMPKMDGLDLLKEIKKDEVLRVMPVLILTASEHSNDIKSAYYLGANCYILKPTSIEKLQKVMQSIHDFWFHIVKYPPKY